jgi:PAS domain S-box-containing protein/putative nucleotidyltransferase with HDIG domain
MSDRPAIVLLIEDNPGDARLIREMLAEGRGARFQLECIDRLSAGLKYLVNNDIGLVLLDLGLPDSQGFDTFTKTYAQAPGVPIIVLSGLADEQLAIKTVQEGAQDYLVKGHVDSHALVRTIRYAIERKRMEELLRESETQVRKLFEAIPDSILVHDDEGTILHINEIGAQQLEWSAKDLVGKNLREIVTPENRASIADHIRETLKVGWCRFETTYVSRSGWQIMVEVNDRPITFGKAKAILRVARDVTDRKRAEAKAKYLNLILRTIRRVNQVIIREKDRDKLLKGACENLVENRGYYSAWIALLDESGGLVITAEAGLGKAFLPMIEQLKRGEITACGQKALSQPDVVVTEDPLSTCADCPLTKQYADRGAMTVQLEYGGRVYGLSSVSIPVDFTVDEEEQALFTGVAADIAFALHSLELEEERKSAEDALRSSHDYLKRLTNSMGDAVFSVKMPGRVIEWANDSFKLIGYDPRECIGRTTEFLYPDKSEFLNFGNKLKKALAAEKNILHAEQLLQRKNGEVFPAEITATLFREKGKIVSVTNIVRDITERKEAEEALLREKNFSAAVMNSSLGLLFVFDDKGNIIQWNRNAEKVTGYSAKEISKMNVLDFVAKEDQKTAAEAMQEAFTKGQSSLEINVLSKPGKKTPFYITGLRTKFENTTCVVCTGIDVTERKQAERELQRSYHKLRESLIATVNTLASTVEMRDPYTAGHQRRATLLACAMAEEMGLTEEQFDGLRMAGLTHDIGKISVPAEILSKPGSLNETEFNIIKTHPQLGYDILKGIEFPWPVAQIVLQHHERLNGSGYPQGLRGEETMLEARILAVADVVEAMASHRPFRPALGIDAALEEITKNKGILYEPEMVDVCKRLFTEKGFAFE